MDIYRDILLFTNICCWKASVESGNLEDVDK